MVTSPRILLSPQGPECSRVVAGMWRMSGWHMPPQQRLSFLKQCLDLGVTTFDNADIYGSYAVERLFGEAIALQPSVRSRMQIVSKCGIKLVSSARPDHKIKHYDTSRAHILASVDNSLRLHRTDYLDLLLIHRPDPLMNFDEIAEAFSTLSQMGKVGHFGVSNFTPTAFQALHRRFPLVTNQVEFSPLHCQPIGDGIFDILQDLGLAPMVWSPLAGGKIFVSPEPHAVRLRQLLNLLAEAHQCSMVSIIFAWILMLPCHPLPLTGTGRIDSIREAVEGACIKLSREEWFAVLEAAQGSEVA